VNDGGHRRKQNQSGRIHKSVRRGEMPDVAAQRETSQEPTNSKIGERHEKHPADGNPADVLRRHARMGAHRELPTAMIGLSLETALAFALTSLVIELTPGPNMAYLAILSVGAGRRAGFAATLGVALGLLIVGLGAALGLTALIANSQVLYQTLRWVGAFYLLWLAWEGWRGEAETSPGKAGSALDTRARYFMRGLVTNLLNPKAGLFYVAVLPTFVDNMRPLVGQTVTLSLIYVAVATLVHATIVLLADAARPWLEDGRRSMIVRRALSLLLVAIAAWLLVTTRR
jgi:threonine/homoserine/homoserine lactone efflux protein